MAGVVLVLACTAACGAVHVTPTSVNASDRRACQTLVKNVPQRVSQRARRATKGSSLSAAWGDPAIVLRCGVGTPEDYHPTSACQRVNGVDWFVPEKQIDDQGADVVMTTIGRKPRVEIEVPATYRPPDAVMVDLADAIKKHTKDVSPCS